MSGDIRDILGKKRDSFGKSPNVFFFFFFLKICALICGIIKRWERDIWAIVIITKGNF